MSALNITQQNVMQRGRIETSQLQTQEISPWINSSKIIDEDITTPQKNYLEKDSPLTQKPSREKVLYSIPKMHSLRVIDNSPRNFDTIPRVYKLFQDKIQQVKLQPMKRSTSMALTKANRPAVTYQQFKINQNKDYIPLQLRQSKKIPIPQRFHNKRQQKFKGDLHDIFRQTLKTPAVCNRIRNIVRLNMAINSGSLSPHKRRYSQPFCLDICSQSACRFTQKGIDLKKTMIQFNICTPNSPKLSHDWHRISQRKVDGTIRQTKHILDQFLEKYHE